MTMAAPNWYQDPSNAASQRWWSGQAWTEHTRPLPGPYEMPAPAPAAMPTEWDIANTLGRPLTKRELKNYKRQYGPRYGGPTLAMVALILNPLLLFSIFGIVYSVRGLRWANELEQQGRRPTGYGWNIAGIVIGILATVLSLGLGAIAVSNATAGIR